MSNTYIKEPPTSGKVRLKTTVGDIDIELWTKEAPKACKNFIHLCMLSYYNETIFHRVIPKSIVQGGDPTGTGCGGESVYGAPFKDEFHSRLRFTRRGLVAMANSGAPNQNGSQFFFTLAALPHLEKKHTIFGTVAGETVFNMIKLGEGRVDPRTDRPDVLHRIKSVEIVVNPFTDIVVEKPVPQTTGVNDREPVGQIKAVRNYSLLSFGDDTFEDGEQTHREIFVPKIVKSNIPEVVLPISEEPNEVEKPKDSEAKISKVEFLRAEGEKLRSEIRELSAKNVETKPTVEPVQPVSTLEDYDEGFGVYSKLKKLPEDRKSRISVVEKMLDKFKENFKKAEGLVEYSDDEEEYVSSTWLHHRLYYDPEEEVKVANPVNQLENQEYAINDPRNSINKRRRMENFCDINKFVLTVYLELVFSG